MRVICVGDVMIDVLAQLPGELAHGSDTPAPVTVLGGGSAANTAAWLVAAGTPATFAGRVGDDPLGPAALDGLRRAGVDLAVTVDRDRPTGTCIVLVDPSGERTMIPSAGANAGGADVPAVSGDAHLHVSGYALFHPESCATAAAALGAARRAGCTVSVDASSAAPLRSFGPDRFLDLTAAALLFANADEAAVLVGPGDPATAVQRLGRRYGEAVVKAGSDGAWWSDGERVERVAAEPVHVLDSTGAGDAFAAGVLTARLGGADVITALAAGTALAARAVGRVGARPA